MAKTSKPLVIVESPTKARTLSRFLGKDFIVESSIGHVRDLPESAKEIPASLKKEPWARLGIDIENGFRPLYIVPAAKKKQVSKLKDLLKNASSLYLATDEDREGESISWHLCEVLKPKVPRQRLVFHEITREAIQEALKQPRDIDECLVKAQETRRILDRLFGYEVSPVLWRKIRPKLSAGRVQSIAVRMIVDRERDRIRFVSASYWDLLGVFSPRDEATSSFNATLINLGGKRLATGKDFDDKGNIRPGADVRVLSEEQAGSLTERLRAARWRVSSVERRPYTDRPAPPFTTSTLQQEANRKLRYSARQTMQVAQRLYENGHITYMRTDSTALSEQAITNARNLIQKLYGPEYLSGERRQYKTRVKNAQEAHEAIRPAGERFELPEELIEVLDPAEMKLYELIWKRTMACQMAEARGHRIAVQVEGRIPEAGEEDVAIFQATGKSIEFPGYLRAYVEGADDPDAELADKEVLLPAVNENDPLVCSELEPKGHSTQPPPRFTESSLIKELEQNGVGRPSTYATIIDTILRREYVVKQGNALVPNFIAFAVVSLLEKNFGRLVDTQFTARMEDDLDSISRGEREPLPYLKEFYYGNGGAAGLKELIKADIDARETCTIRLGKDSSGREINIRIGKYGPYLERSDERTNIPDGIPPDALTIKKAEELLEKGSGATQLGQTPEGGELPPGEPVYLKNGRYGPYVQLGESGKEKPKMKSLLPGMEPSSVTLEMALQLLSLPRILGKDEETGEEVIADLGRYGQYVKRGKERGGAATINPPESVLDITLERAIQLLKEKPPGRQFARAAPSVIRELGTGPRGGDPIRLMTGRYGPYVTDGKINASLMKDQSPENITLEDALELIRARAERGAGRRPTRRGKKSRKAAKKTSVKKAKKVAGSKKKSSKKKS